MNRLPENDCRSDAKCAENNPHSSPQLLATATDLLLQGLHLLFRLDDRTYSKVAPAPYNVSIGSHFRRVLEPLECLVKGFRPVEIDYDSPERNARLEQDVAYASIASCDILRFLKRIRNDALSEPSPVICSPDSSGRGSGQRESTFGRELQYCIGHAVHHFDIIRLICGNLGIRVPDEFGDAGAARKIFAGLVAQ